MKIVLASLSARQIHKTLAPWCLKAYIDAQSGGDTAIVSEHSVNDPVNAIVEALYREHPDLVGFSCYIWNIEQVQKVAVTLKKLLPKCLIVLGGPEVSFEADGNAFPYADAIIAGAGEEALHRMIERLKERGHLERTLWRQEEVMPFARLPSPFTDAYFDSFAAGEIAQKLIYYESTRGCPFRCSYCLSGISPGVDALPLERVYQELALLSQKGARIIKFVDRTFNADKQRALEIFAFIGKLETDCTFHFEVAADLFDEALLEAVSKMPIGRVQFEAGIQSVNPQTLCEVHRKTDLDKAFSVIQRLVSFGNCHVHVDLIAGMPMETLDTFRKGINRCLMAKPHMLQLGFLKLLKGSKLREESINHGIVFADHPPYEVLLTDSMSYDDLICLSAMEALIDKYYNSGMFVNTLQYAMDHLFADAFTFFLNLAKYIGDGRKAKTTLKFAYTLLLDFLLANGGGEEARHLIKLDCLTFDSKGMLPDAVQAMRNKERERSLGLTHGRVEFFPWDGLLRAFDYTSRHPITKAYRVELL